MSAKDEYAAEEDFEDSSSSGEIQRAVPSNDNDDDYDNDDDGGDNVGDDDFVEGNAENSRSERISSPPISSESGMEVE